MAAAAACAAPATTEETPSATPTVVVNSVDVAAKPYEVRPGLDPDLVMTVDAPDGWQPRPDRPLDEQLPEPWPDKYVEVHGQPFNPWAYKVNASLLCAHARAHPDEATAVEPIARALFQRMLDYTLVEEEARFVIYDFPQEYKGYTVPAGGTSGLGNGSAIAGTLALDQCWPDEDYVDVAYELAEAYRVLPEDETDLWFSLVTDDGFLWFEEQPLPNGRPSMILNGHVTALTGLYYLWDRAGHDRDVLTLLRAGITAARRYAPEYRRPGRTNCYDLLPPCHDDYGPERTVRQQHVLHALSDDKRFRRLRDQFAVDMGVDPTQFEVE